jgi:hypothetical protein
LDAVKYPPLNVFCPTTLVPCGAAVELDTNALGELKGFDEGCAVPVAAEELALCIADWAAFTACCCGVTATV